MCRAEAPAVAEVHEKYGNDVTFVGVAGRDGFEPIADFVDKFEVGAFKHIVDETGQIWDEFRISSQPSFIFIDAAGEGEVHVGAMGVEGLTERLDRLIAT